MIKNSKSYFPTFNTSISLLFMALMLMMSHLVNAETFYVDQNHILASDDNPGTEEEPFLTVQKGINTADFRDTVYIKEGIYNLLGFTKDLDQPISIIGEDKHTVILDSISTLNIIANNYANTFTLKGVTFTNYSKTIIDCTVGLGDTLNGIEITDCIFAPATFTSKTRLIQARYDVHFTGFIINVHISYCDFLGITAPGVKIIYLYEGKFRNINISNNNFYNLISNSDTRGTVGVYVGNNSSILSNKSILVSGNFFDTIIASDSGEIETHAILCYGDSIKILQNTIMEMTPGTDHEAIYLKGRYSLIDDNVMINCTSHQGAIAIKGTGDSFHNIITNNRVQSDQSGRGIYTAGPEYVRMEGNYVKNTSAESTNGLYIYGANNSPCIMTNNYSQGAGVAAYMHDVSGGEISFNTLISYDTQTIKLTGSSSNIILNLNNEHLGWPVDPPIAMAAADTVEGPAPLDINFSAEGSYDPNGFIVYHEWNFHDGSTSTDPNPSHTFTEPRIYTATLIVTDADGFKDMSYVVIRVLPEEEVPVIISSHASQDDNIALQVYPNPFKNSANFNYKIKTEARVSVEVYDLSGKIIRNIFNGIMRSGRHTTSWDGRDEHGVEMPAGIYIIKCQVGEYQETKQLIKNK